MKLKVPALQAGGRRFESDYLHQSIFLFINLLGTVKLREIPAFSRRNQSAVERKINNLEPVSFLVRTLEITFRTGSRLEHFNAVVSRRL